MGVDGFGTGYSSLSYLKHLPVTTLKVDRSFVDKVAGNPDDAAIASAVIAMAHRLKLEVIAEGVETEAQLAYLRAENCDAIQGRLFSPALSTEALERLLRGEGLQLPGPPPGVGDAKDGLSQDALAHLRTTNMVALRRWRGCR